jgi:SAM-dependent methyltransferase
VQSYGCHVVDVLFGLCYECIRPGQRLLDAGIGSGLSAQLFAKAGLEVHGMDFSPAMLAACRAKGFAVDLRLHDLQQAPWPYQASGFDHVACCGVLHFIADVETIFGEAARVLGEFDRLQAATEQIRAGQSGRLTIASHPWAATALLPGVVATFLADRPGVEVRLISRHSDVISQLLPTESFEIGIAEMPIDPSAIELTRYTMRCVAILPPGHRLASREALVPSDLSSLPMVAAARSLQLHGRVAGAFAEAGLPVRIAVEAELFASVCAAPEAEWRITKASAPPAASVSAVSFRLSPFETLEPFAEKLIRSADKRFAASSNDVLVRVESS